MNTLGMERVRVPKTAEVVAHAIRTQIVRGEIAEGEALPSEAQLMSQFGVSRPSLREAFRILESEKLIVVRRGSRGGARALRPDLTVAARYLGLLMQFEGVLLRDVFQARALIEPIAVRLLAQNPTCVESSQELREILGQISTESTVAQRVDIWLGFYQRMFELAGNETIRILYGTLTEVIRRELIDTISESMSKAMSDGPHTDRLSQKAVNKAMDLVAEGKGEEAAQFWMGQMLTVQESVAQQHRLKTVSDIAVDQL